jgi:hypothetical protein
MVSVPAVTQVSPQRDRRSAARYRPLPVMMQKLQQLPVPVRILAFAAAAVAVLAVAAGVGVMAALALGPGGGSPQGAKTERVREVNLERGDRPEENAQTGVSDTRDSKEKASDAPGGVAYVDEVASIQNRSVEASLRSNDKLLRYDGLTAGDVETLKANFVALKSYARRARDLAPSARNEDHHGVFVRAIGELRDANELAYRLVADPSSATQTDFEAYDRHVDGATAYLRRSNEILGKDYKTTAAAQEISAW